ncbi:Serine/threonine-protein kinase PrkC [Crateriforma conspicua]|uniref:Serine/threonine-protein kinase PrkC n=1 Tax=Crateriforma conspicua TaxID=2527996 RepID=A0A5C6FWE7_9PLAN|nr:serine/threonine-protein kinase [Crateriforma conspicua]TWU66696.1 Serine/threonine-protein kinase PrkC [Crateriforma conspicua]
MIESIPPKSSPRSSSSQSLGDEPTRSRSPNGESVAAQSIDSSRPESRIPPGSASVHPGDALDGLNEDQQHRLSLLLEQYLSAIESGKSVDTRTMAADDPALLAPLQRCVDGLKHLQQCLVGTDSHLSDLAAPSHLDDFRLIRPIGRGGMGIVYEALQESLNRVVAVKLLPWTSTLDEKRLRRFQNEAEAAGQLQHPNIVPVYAVGCQRGIHYYAMPLIDGPSVEERIGDRSINPDWRWNVSAVADIADALQSAHQCGVVHRDVKPSNLIIDSRQKLWITDFGLAQYATNPSLTQTGDIVGTAKYMSPEQACGMTALVDGRSDIFSLAATLYEMLTGEDIHQGISPTSRWTATDAKPIDSVRRRRPELPRDLDTVLQKAMSVQRDQRYDTAGDFADDLRRVVAGQPTNARPPSVGDKMIRVASRHRRAFVGSIAAACLIFIAMAAGIAIITTQKQIAEDHRRRSNRFENLSRIAVDSLGTQMADMLADVPEASGARRRLLDQTINYYRRFVAEAQRDSLRQSDLAETQAKIGRFQMELGRPELAAEDFRHACDTYTALVRQDPADLRTRLQWTVCQNNLAESLAQLGHTAQAARCFTDAIENQQSLIESAVADTDGLQRTARRHQARTWNNLGCLLARQNRITEARRAFQMAIDGVVDDPESLTASTPKSGSPSTAADLRASIRCNLGRVLLETDPALAHTHLAAATSHYADQSKANPGDRNLAYQHAVALGMLGSACSRAERPVDAYRHFVRARTMLQTLAPHFADTDSDDRELVACWNQSGVVLQEIGRDTEAADAVRQAVQIQTELAKRSPDDPATQHELARLLVNLGLIQAKIGQTRAARTTLTRAVDTQNDVVRLTGSSEDSQADLVRFRRSLQEVASR